MFSVNRKIDIFAEEMVDFHDQIIFSKCRYYRFLSEENSLFSLSESIERMMGDGILFHDIFFMLIPIPNGKVIDVFVPIVEESENEQV